MQLSFDWKNINVRHYIILDFSTYSENDQDVVPKKRKEMAGHREQGWTISQQKVSLDGKNQQNMHTAIQTYGQRPRCSIMFLIDSRFVQGLVCYTDPRNSSYSGLLTFIVGSKVPWLHYIRTNQSNLCADHYFNIGDYVQQRVNIDNATVVKQIIFLLSFIESLRNMQQYYLNTMVIFQKFG